MPEVLFLEQRIRRTLGGIRVVDHLTGAPITTGLRLTSRDLRFAPTWSGAFQITEAPGFGDYARAFDTVPSIATGTFSFEIHDMTRRFLPLSARITLPRDARPEALTNRVDLPVEVALASSPSRAPSPGWTMLRLSLHTPANAPIPGALVRALRAGTDEELGWGLSDQNGSVLLPLIGIPILQEAIPGDDDDDDDDTELTTAVTRLRVAVAVDPALPWPASTQDLRSNAAHLRRFSPLSVIDLTAGGFAHQRLTLPLP